MEQKTVTTQDPEKYQRKAILSKLKGLNDHLAALIQKKVRIDLEIKKTRNVITRIRQRSSFQMKLSTSLESDLTGDPFQDFPALLRIQANQEIEDQLALEADRAEELLREVTEIEDYLYDPNEVL